MIRHGAFWAEVRRTGGIFLYDEVEKVTKRNAAGEELLFFLEQMRQQGVELFVDGEAALPGEIVSKAVCEDSLYMADYVLGEKGKIDQIRYDKVTIC